ncbi:hypothetical protein PSEUDO8Z_100440 [Pseudomonas sp. 8Z]|nr:hypothetical protein PSEUDO8Z_100440 [Pseudomonas sp. 8Z]
MKMECHSIQKQLLVLPDTCVSNVVDRDPLSLTDALKSRSVGITRSIRHPHLEVLKLLKCC